jgi:uncharacterized protein YegL
MKDATEIVIVLDKSGSMERTRDEAISGFNEFLREQKALPGEAHMSMYQFNSRVKCLYEHIPILEAAELTTESFAPEGWTSLYDAIGTAIQKTGERLAALPEEERPNKVMLAIITDGQENTSSKYSLSQVNNMIDVQRNTYSWHILFIGSTLQAQSQREAFCSIQGSHSMSYGSAQNAATMYNTLSSGVKYFRKSRSGADHAKQLEATGRSFYDTNEQTT